jgi:hypothetical protein
MGPCHRPANGIEPPARELNLRIQNTKHKTKNTGMKRNRLLTIISALAVLAGGVGAAHAQNKVVNGTFSANAAVFTVSPGGVGNTDGSVTNPPIAS